MKDLYESNESCMGFSNETLKEHFINKVRNFPNVKLECSYCDECSEMFYQAMKEHSRLTGFPDDYVNKTHRIDCISFDGENGDFDIHFHDSGVVTMCLYDEYFMFIDDQVKLNIRCAEGCIVYDGYLRDKTHEQILQIFFELFKILNGTKEIKYEEHLVSKIGFYRKNDYIVRLTKPNHKKEKIQFENILFLIN